MMDAGRPKGTADAGGFETKGPGQQGLIRSGTDHLLVLDADGHILFASEAFVGLVDGPGSTIVGAPVVRFLDWTPTAGEIARIDGHLRCRDGVRRPVAIECLTPGGRDPSAIGHVLAIHDPTIGDRMSARVAFISSHDPMSGLPDRQQAIETISQGLLATDNPFDLWVGLLRVNHGAFRSAAALEAAYARMVEAARSLLPPAVQLFRTSSEFLMCVGDLDPAVGPVERLVAVRDLCQSDRIPEITTVDARSFVLARGALLDVPRCLIDAEGLFDRQGYRDPAVAVAIKGSDVEATLVQDFQRALTEGELTFHLQPEVSAETGMLLGAELLCRWNHPTLGLLPPYRFIPIAESEPFRAQFAAWCVDAAFEALERLRQLGLGDLRLAINVSAPMLEETDLPAWLAARREAQPHLAGQLEIEITESALAQDFSRARKHLTFLRSQGYKVAIDDFGTGYSSLSYLREFPIDRLKIDRSFVRGLGENEDDALICTAIISLSHALGLQVIAEGVETRAQAQFLRESGCEQLQGYLISKPVPFEAFRALALNWESIDVGFDDQPLGIHDDDHDRTLKRVHWKRSFSVDITSIDKEHADIIKHINRIADLLHSGASLPMVTGHVETIVAETRRHFRHEEAVMGNIGFPHLERHKAKHDALMADIDRYVASVLHGDYPPTPSRLLAYLKFWFLRHLITEDRLIERFINGRPGVQGDPDTLADGVPPASS